MVHRAGFVGRMGPPQGDDSSIVILDLTARSVPSYTTFTRASTGTYFNSAGALETAATNVPRLDFNPLTLQPRGLLLEGTRTNLCVRSEELDNASWFKGDVTITANNSVAPNGTTTMDLVTEGSAGTAECVSPVPTVTAASPITVSGFLRIGNNDWVRFLCCDTTNTNGVNVWVNLATGALGTVSAQGAATNVSATIQNVGNGIFRVTGTYTHATDTTAKVTMRSAVSNGSATRVSGATYSAWGFQIEQASFASSYIPTTGTAATRAADVATIPSLASIGFNPLQGAILVECELNSGLQGAGLETQIVGLDNNTSVAGSASRIGIARSTGGFTRAQVINTGVTQTDIIGGTAWTASSIVKAAVAFATDDCVSVFNGTIQGTDATVTLPTDIVNMRLFNRLVAPSGENFGWLRRLTYYPTRPSNAQIQALNV